MDAKKRNLTNKLQALLELFPAVIVLGARQSGKTTLVKHFASQTTSNWQYLDLEKPEDYELITRDPSFFFARNPNHIIIDESQTYPVLFKVLRGIIDNDRMAKGRFILTGSSSPDLQKHAAETLAGRVAIIELSNFKVNELVSVPLSNFYNIFNEKLNQELLNHTLTTCKPLESKDIHYLWLHGGYPEPALSKDEKFIQLWLENYRKTYVDRDVASLFPKLNRHAYQRFLSILGKLSGTIINKSDLARNIEIDEKTVREYLTIADGTFLWKILPSFEQNIVKSIIKMPKGYLRDTGLLHYLLKIFTKKELYEHPIVGASFEAFAIEELIRGLSATLVTNWQPYYYRTRNGVEVDLILTGPFGTLPIEIKYGIKIQNKYLKNITTFVTDHDLPYGIIVNQAEQIRWLNDKMIQIPIGYI